MTTFTYTTFTSNAGHSAKSPGAGANGYEEHTQARLCNNEFIKVMKKFGHYVVDTTSDASNSTAVLQEQVAKANRIGGGEKQLNLSYHLNAGGGSGVEVLYYGEATKNLAATISAAISEALGVKDRGAKQRKDLYFLKQTKAHSVLIEVCFIDNLIDMQRLSKKRSKAMEAVAEVLVGPLESSDDSSTENSTSSTVSTGQSTYKGSSVVDYLKSIGADSSFSNRAKLAVKYGVVKASSEYKGTASQNTALLKAMRG